MAATTKKASLRPGFAALPTTWPSTRSGAASACPTSASPTTTGLANTLTIADDGPDDILAREETHTRLRALIQELPAAQKEVLLMRHYGDMSFQEIADATGVSINTALGRMRYALINLRKKMTANSRLL